MKEQNRYSEQKKYWYTSDKAGTLLRRLPSPQKRNEQFRLLFEQLPDEKSIVIPGEGYNEETRQFFAKRKNTEMTRAIMKRLNRLLRSARVTASAKQEITENFERWTELGIDREGFKDIGITS